MRKMAFSLPGMMRAERITVSSWSTLSSRWLSTATRESEDIGSAWLPLTSTTIFCGSNDRMSCGRTTMPSGIRSRPMPCAISTLSTMLRPTKPTLRPTAAGDVHDLLDARNRAGEAGDQHLARRRAAQLLDAVPHGAFRRRVAGPLDIGAVAEERQHALLAVARKGVQVERLAVDRRRVHLEIAGVDDHAHRRADGQRHAVDRAVRDVDELDLERPDLDACVRESLRAGPLLSSRPCSSRRLRTSASVKRVPKIGTFRSRRI